MQKTIERVDREESRVRVETRKLRESEREASVSGRGDERGRARVRRGLELISRIFDRGW